MNIKIFLLLVIVSLTYLESNAQSYIGYGIGQTDLKNDSLSWTTGSFLSLQRQIKIGERPFGLIPTLEIGFMHSHSGDSLYPQYFSVVGLSPLFYTELIKKEKFSFNLHAGPSIDWVLGIKKGDLSQEPYGPESFNNFYFGFKAGLSFEYSFFEKLRLKINPFDIQVANNSYKQWTSSIFIQL